MDSSYPPFECNSDNNDPPLVEIGEVIYAFFNRFLLNGELQKTSHYILSDKGVPSGGEWIVTPPCF